MEEEIFPIPEELAFNLREGRYRAPLACKLFGFVRLKNGKAEEFDRRYGALANAISSDGALRGHTLSRTLDAVIRPGRAVQWPPVGSEHFDRAVEYYFESPEAMGQFCAAGRLKGVTDLFSELGQACFWDATRIQEIFYTATGDQPLEENWKALYSH
ncbi:MAG: hypothetical protein BGO51_16155 [Rhodospirillales bacterium 69-11]|nr:MAG: hypothetical protein BGN85_02505 [Alphaproteobacteria bacterium 64-11]OJW22261.1 MAG: hypothetical protein BGO51_16155 [Rhodospirillales bacterium 69-11]